MTIKAIIFDVGGVLALPRYPIMGRSGQIVSGVHSSIAKKLGISIDQYFDSIDENYTKSIEGKKSEKEIIKTMAQNLKISQSKLRELYIHAYKTRFKQNKELFRFAYNLKKRGFKIAILSDQWPLSRKGIMPEKFYTKFDKVMVSYELGLRKPNPKIFHLTLKKLRITPSEAIFVDNQEWNIKASKKIRIKTVYFKNNKQAIKDIEKLLK